MATDTGIIYRKSTEEDLQSIAEFRKTNFAYNPSVRSCEADYYYWKCYQNPVQKGEIWLAETNNEIVAMKSVIPKEMLIRGEVVKVAEMGDSFTRPDYQRRGIFTELSKISRQSIIDKGIRLIYNTPTKATSLPGYLNKLDHVRIPVTLQSMVKPISSSINIAFSIPGNSIMRLFIPPAIALSRFRFNIATKKMKGGKIRVSQEQRFTDEVDDLWGQNSEYYDVALVRSKDNLNWRYVENPDSYRILIARGGNGNARGYMVTKTSLFNGVPIGYVVDYLTSEHHIDVFTRLIAYTMNLFMHDNVSMVITSAVKEGFYHRSLTRMGFFAREDLPLLCYKNDLGKHLIENHYKWHLTAGDSDSV